MSKHIQCKASMHTGKKYSTRHNLRTLDTDRSNLDGHIDYDRTHLNQILVNKPLRSFVDETFGDSLLDFNHKNWVKHPERVIGYSKREYDSLVKTKGEEKAKEMERAKAVSVYLQQQRRQVQEVIVQFGDHDTYLQMVETLGQKSADEFYSEMLKAEFEEWQQRNPAMKVFCATVHMDEVKDGTPHLHIDFLPVAESKTGLKTKVNVDGALKECGFKRDNKNDTYGDRPYTKWLNSNREKIERDFETFANRFLQAVEQFRDKLRVTVLPSEETPKGHKRKTTAQWKEEQARERAEQQEARAEKAAEQAEKAEQKLADYEVPPPPTVRKKPSRPRITESKKDYINRNIKEYVEDMQLGRTPKDLAITAKKRKEYGDEWEENQRQWAEYDKDREAYAKWEQDIATQKAMQSLISNKQAVAERERRVSAQALQQQKERSEAYKRGIEKGKAEEQQKTKQAVTETTGALQRQLDSSKEDMEYVKRYLRRSGLDIDGVIKAEKGMEQQEENRYKNSGYPDLD